MPRNLDRRVEVLLRVDDPASTDRLDEILQINLEDTVLAWELQSDGSYRRLAGTVNAHDEFERLATGRAEKSSEQANRKTEPPSNRLRQYLPRRRANP